MEQNVRDFKMTYLSLSKHKLFITIPKNIVNIPAFSSLPRILRLSSCLAHILESVVYLYFTVSRRYPYLWIVILTFLTTQFLRKNKIKVLFEISGINETSYIVILLKIYFSYKLFYFILKSRTITALKSRRLVDFQISLIFWVSFQNVISFLNSLLEYIIFAISVHQLSVKEMSFYFRISKKQCLLNNITWINLVLFWFSGHWDEIYSFLYFKQ